MVHSERIKLIPRCTFVMATATVHVFFIKGREIIGMMETSLQNLCYCIIFIYLISQTYYSLTRLYECRKVIFVVHKNFTNDIV